MRVMRKDFSWAVSEGVISEGQAEDLWRVLERRNTNRPFGYVGHLAWEIFEDSLLFPFVLSTAGLVIIALGILYAKNRDRIEGAMVRAVPTGIRRVLPMEREAR